MEVHTERAGALGSLAFLHGVLRDSAHSLLLYISVCDIAWWSAEDLLWAETAPLLCF